jgi:hypothetical protein
LEFLSSPDARRGNLPGGKHNLTSDIPVRPMPENTNMATPPDTAWMAATGLNINKPAPPRGAAPADTAPAPSGGIVELDMTDAEVEAEDAKRIEAVQLQISPALPRPVQAAPRLIGRGQEAATPVAFHVPGGTLRTSYQLVVINEGESAVMLGVSHMAPGMAVFEPEPGTDLKITVGEGDAAVTYLVISCGITFNLDGWRLLVLPVKAKA